MDGSLDKPKRDSLPASDFAVPGKRKLPMHDATHVKLAWDMVERTGGLSESEKKTARARILKRAADLGVDTKDWHKIAAMHFDAMALNIQNDDAHPNKMPFSGILVRLDQPSDFPPGGSGGRNIVLTSAAAEKALGSLLGMAVDYTPSFDGHDSQAKIGIITSANIADDAIHISGFIYAADFPEQSIAIRADKAELGFSFEAQQIMVADPGADPLEITGLAFTGAAILRKDKAAYQTTSLAAKAEMEFEMTKEELQALLAESMKPVTDRLAKIEADRVEDQKAIEANKTTIKMVEPHAQALEACAGGMQAAGIGLEPTHGHVAVLHRMAGSMRSMAASGKVPSEWHEGFYGAKEQKTETPPDISKIVADAIEKATKPITEKLAASETALADLKASTRSTSPPPERKTLGPMIAALLAKASVTLPEGDEKISISKLDDALKAANLPTDKRLMVKGELSRAGLL